MASVLPLISFGLGFAAFLPCAGQRSGEDSDWRGAFVKSSVLSGLIVAASTESLTLLHAFTWPGVALVWVLAILVLGTVLGRRWNRNDARKWMSRLTAFRSGMTLTRVAPLIGIVLVCALVFIVAILAPPNTNDSLTYHMSRVMHWIQGRGVGPYPTAISRQLWMPPLAEYIIAHVTLLARSDSPANLVQWFSLVGSVIAVTSIARQLGAGLEGQLVAGLLAATIPMAILQGSSTQNDLVTSFWVVLLVDQVLGVIRRGAFTWRDGFWVGAISGLGVLTKGTFPAFALPLIAWLGLHLVLRKQLIPVTKFAFIGVSLVFLLNVGHWRRNLVTYGMFLGPTESVQMQSGIFLRPNLLLSNLTKNLVFHLATPFEAANRVTLSAYLKVHEQLGVNIDATTFRPENNSFSVLGASLHEDIAGNLLPLSVLAASSLALCFGSPVKDRQFMRKYLSAWLGMFVLFSLFYPWQPWGSRLELPWFVAGSPIAGLASRRLPGKRSAVFVTGLLLSASLPWLLSNSSRPLIPIFTENPSVLTSPRETLLFSNRPTLEKPYSGAVALARKAGCDAVGLRIDSSDPEYIFWSLLGAPWNGLRIEHVGVEDDSRRLARREIKPCVVVCTICSTQVQIYPDYDLIGNSDGVQVYELEAEP